MPVEIRHDPQTCTEVRLWGTVTAADIDDLSERLTAVAGEWSRILYDAAEVENPSEALALFLRSPWRVAMPAHVRQAAVVGPGAAAVARAWLRATREGTSGTQSFTSSEQAREWLMSGYQAVSGGS